MAGCDTDDDCNGPKGQGRCESLDSTLFPDKQCMCSIGWFGNQCQKKAVFKDRYLDLDGYQEQPMGVNNKFYWKIHNGEVDVVFQVTLITLTSKRTFPSFARFLYREKLITFP